MLNSLKSLALASTIALSSIVGLAAARAIAAASTTPWYTCSYRKPGYKQVIKDCRIITLTDNAYRVALQDGKADVYYYINNGVYVDTRGGYWDGKTEVYQMMVIPF